MDSTSQLRALLELLKEFGVLEYSDGTTSLKMGGSISVHKHGAEPLEGVRELPKLDPELARKFRSLPADYQRAFTIGQD